MRVARRLQCAALGLALATASGACARSSSRLDVGAQLGEAQTRSSDNFVGWIRDVRGSVIIVDEEVATSGRRGEIFVETTTEIVSRTGMIVPQSWLKKGLRVTVEFRNTAREAAGNLSATARKIVVDM